LSGQIDCHGRSVPYLTAQEHLAIWLLCET
jgi:hypothetical protein